MENKEEKNPKYLCKCKVNSKEKCECCAEKRREEHRGLAN